MNPNNGSKIDTTIHSKPIAIGLPANRRRSASVSSSSSSGESSPEFKTPMSWSKQHISADPSTSPILSHFFAQSPAKATSFPFKRNFGPTPVFEEEERVPEPPVAAHARRASTSAATRFSQQQIAPIPDPLLERGTGLLRRLSLSTPFGMPQYDSQARRPTTPPNTAVNAAGPRIPSPSRRTPKRAATINSETGRPRRAPSPMGERILKGHFDGFN